MPDPPGRQLTDDMAEIRDLSVVIPSYNARALLRRTLRTLSVAAPEAEVIVVDGCSRDGSPEMVRDEFPGVALLSFENYGFAHAVNRGLERARGEFVLLLNSDLFVSRAAIETMMTRLAADTDVGGVAPVLLNEDGTRQYLFGLFYWPNYLPIRKATRVPLLNAACLMTRRDVLYEVGGFDENFFLYNEEYDWCARVIGAGYHLELIPERVVHVRGGSTPRTPELTLEAQRGFLYLAQKHAPAVVVEGLRRAMQFEGFCWSRVDPRPRHRAMWARLESLTKRAAYLESPFALSGRGDAPARPRWRAMERPIAVSGSSPGQQPRPTPLPVSEPAPAEAPASSGPAPAHATSVVRLSADRVRVNTRRSRKVAGATG